MTQNLGIIYYKVNLIKELKTLIELLRESLTNLISKLHAELGPKKKPQPQTNEAEDTNKNKPQASHYHYQT